MYIITEYNQFKEDFVIIKNKKTQYWQKVRLIV